MLYNFADNYSGDETPSEVEQIVQDISKPETKQLASDAGEKYGSRPTKQISGKKLATPAVRKMAMENNVSLLCILIFAVWFIKRCLIYR